MTPSSKRSALHEARFIAAYGRIRPQRGGTPLATASATRSPLIFLAAASLQAHHSFSATYDGNKPITLRGTIVKMGWQNPHAHLYVDVKNADGKVVTWEVESAGPTSLR